MLKILIISFSVLVANLYACNCKVEGEKIRCDYYVVKKHDLSRQKHCIKYAETIDKDNMPAKASWYYLLGGDTKKAKESANKALKIGQYFVSEYLSFVSLLEKNDKEAQKYFNELKKSVKDTEYVKRDIITMKNLYDSFDAEKASKMLVGK
jgi:hypothetical protein